MFLESNYFIQLQILTSAYDRDTVKKVIITVFCKLKKISHQIFLI